MNFIFTTCTYNHIGRAFALADSIAKNCVDTKLVIGLVDNAQHDFKPSELFEIVTAAEMELPHLDEMCVKYNAIELNSALKAYFAAHILKSKPALKEIIYLDSDILLYQDLTARVKILLEDNSVLISPHALSSAVEVSHENDRNFLKSGIYNAGFFAVKNDQYGAAFLNWWQDKVRNHCFINAKMSLFAEQLWLNLVPLYLERVFVVKDPGYNVAYWNLHERKISQSEETYFVNENAELIFYHFSGTNTRCFEQNTLSVHQTKYTFSNRPDVIPLFKDYVAALKQHSFDKYNAYLTIGKDFKTKSPLLIKMMGLYKKIVKRSFYK